MEERIEKVEGVVENRVENRLVEIVKGSGLPQTKAQIILEQFQGYFALAADWEKKASAIVVTDAAQVAEMKMARAGRLFLGQKRRDVENTRKALKEQILREGQAIDGIAKVLKALIVPIEEHLEKQEKYAENKRAEEFAIWQREQAEKAEAERIEAERIEAERRAKEEAARVAREKAMAAENARLMAEAAERERLAKIESDRRAKEDAARVEAQRVEREKAAAVLRKEAEARAKAEAERKAAEARAEAERKAAAEREAALKRKEAEARAKSEAERKAAEARAEAERKAAAEREAALKRKEAEARAKAEAERKAAAQRELDLKRRAEADQIERERLVALIAAGKAKCPKCGHEFTVNGAV